MFGARLSPDDGTAALDRAEQLDLKETEADLREAYERGRKDGRASRKRHPVFMTFTFVAALAGATLLALAAINGSFTRAGEVVDENLAVAVTQAEPQVRDAASQMGRSLKDTGQAVRPKAAGTAGQPG